MSDGDRYRRALMRRTELETQLRDVEELICLYERLIPGPRPADANPPRTPPRRRTRNPTSPGEIASLCRTIIESRGRPMTRTELHDQLRAGGIHIPGPDPAKTVGTILWRRSTSFAHVKGSGYWLADRPVPASR